VVDRKRLRELHRTEPDNWSRNWTENGRKNHLKKIKEAKILHKCQSGYTY